MEKGLIQHDLYKLERKLNKTKENILSFIKMGLNLKELEKRLDEALASETKESLTTWLKNIKEEKLVIYAFVYNPNKYESCYATMSLHKTKEGAEKAMEAHKKETKEEHELLFEDYESEFSWDYDQNWDIEEIEIQD